MNEITKSGNTSTAIQVAEDYKQIALQWLTSTGNLKQFTENEKNQFFDICCAFKLNPIKKEVYGVKYGNNFNIIVGYETYLKRAQRTGLLDGFNTTTVKDGNDVKAVCTIYRKDWTHPFIHEVYLSEYDTGKSLWQTKKITMIKKVAEAQAFRKCFTDELGGMPYTSEELPLEENINAPQSANLKSANIEVPEVIPANNLSAEPVEPKVKKAKPKFTKEQGQQLASVVNTVFEDGTPVFNDEEKQAFRVRLSNGDFENLYADVVKMRDERQNPNLENVNNENIPFDIY